MKISELPEDIQEKAILNQRYETEFKYYLYTDDLNLAFNWSHTEEGFEFWENWYLKRPEKDIKKMRGEIIGTENTTSTYEIATPKHYDNSKGTLYKVALERNWNAYLFAIVKRLEMAEKKGCFKEDLEKSIAVIKLWLKEHEK